MKQFKDGTYSKPSGREPFHNVSYLKLNKIETDTRNTKHLETI